MGYSPWGGEELYATEMTVYTCMIKGKMKKIPRPFCFLFTSPQPHYLREVKILVTT